ncbi:MAG: amidohydrolase [Candidatus Nanopelagicales bacterium]|nr:amidohydrolase [Candidatus Nanopelagicales bacterium]
MAVTSMFSNGRILTMAGESPEYVECLVVQDGRIAFVGDRATAEQQYPAAEVRDLGGATLLPGFVDPHSHFINALGMTVQANVSAPPVGPCSSAQDVVAELQRFAGAKGGLQPGELLIGYGYDENLLPADHPLTKDDLDPAFPDNPVMAMHVSLHGAVMNSAALALYGFDESTETPPGGVIVRRPGTNEPLGLVMEMAFASVFANLPTPSPEQELEQLRAGQMIYAAAGVTTAQEGATHAAQLAVLQRGAEAGALFIDVIAYPFITDMEKILADNPPETFRTYRNGLKLGGIKITMDGSPQGRTAYFTTPYLTGGPGGEQDWCGEPSFPQEFFDDALQTCYDAGLQVLFHANGDAAIDMILAGHARAAAGSLDADRRSTVIHSQFVRPDQLDKYVEYNLIPSLYTEHTFFFGQAHVANRGPEQAAYLSPMRDVIDRGLKPTNHTDFNVAPIDQMMVVWTAVNRPMRDGSVLGPDQRVTPYEALQAITINSARQHFEEDSKGSLEVGKRADLVVLSDDPLAVDPMAIKDITVRETIKDGRTIYTATG